MSSLEPCPFQGVVFAELSRAAVQRCQGNARLVLQPATVCAGPPPGAAPPRLLLTARFSLACSGDVGVLPPAARPQQIDESPCSIRREDGATKMSRLSGHMAGGNCGKFNLLDPFASASAIGNVAGKSSRQQVRFLPGALEEAKTPTDSRVFRCWVSTNDSGGHVGFGDLTEK
jgi:hypothetical protein